MSQRTADSERRETASQRRSDDAEAERRHPDSRRDPDDRADERAVEAEPRRLVEREDGRDGDDDPSTRTRAERLQRAHGNRAFSRAIEAERDRRDEREERASAVAGPDVPAREPAEPRARPDAERSTASDQQAGRRPAVGDRPTTATPAAPGSPPQRAAPVVQPVLKVGSPNDAYEREAEAVARAVAAGRPAPAVTTPASGASDDDVSRAPVEDDLVQTRSDGSGAAPASPSTVARTIRRPGAGRPLAAGVKNRVEATLGASLEGVRVHAGGRAARAARRLGARAFTHGRHIFLGDGESAQNVELMAHEATHVVQQGATADGRRTAPSGPPDVQRFLPDAAFEKLNEWAGYIPGWKLFTVLIGYNPLLREDVEFTASNLIDALLKLLPGIGKPIADKLREHGIIEDALEWVEGQLNDLNLSIGRVKRTLEAAWDDLSLTGTILGIGEGAVETLERHFKPLYDDVKRFFRSVVDGIVDLIKEAAIDVAEGLLEGYDAWDLVKKVLGRDPLRDEEVEATPTEILEDFLRLIGKEQHLQKMREEGTLEETAQWLAERIGQFQELLGRLGTLIDDAWEAIKPENLPNLLSNLQSLARDVGTLLLDLWTFASTVAGEVLARIKDAMLGALSGFVQNHLPGFDLLTVILGRNPFTGESVARTPANLIKGFITLLPGGKAVYQRLAESGVVEQAGARIEKAIEQLGISWEFVVGLFTGLWESLSIEDLLDPVGAFNRIVERFREPVSRLFRFISVVLRELFGVLLAAMNFPTQLIGSIISNAMQAIEAVKQDPIGFLKNLLGAVKLGFQIFFDNILTHLVGGLADWLFRGLREAGVEPPADLSLQSVLEFVLEVLGLTVDRLWEKLAERIGQENVDRIRGAIERLTGIWSFVQDVRERGIAAIWEHIESQITGLWDMVLEKAQAWVMERVINRAMQWLASLLDPTGVMAVINSFRAFFNAVQSAMEYLTDILAIVNDYVSTLAAVAQGELAAGAQKLEQGLANAIPIAIGFLANQFGLGNIGEKIQEIVAGIRGFVDRALDWLLDRAEAALGSVLGALGFGGQDEENDTEAGGSPEEPFWELRAPFDRAGESHTLLFEGEEDAAELVVRSTRKPLQQWIADARKELEEAKSGMDPGDYGTYDTLLGVIESEAIQIKNKKDRFTRRPSAGGRQAVDIEPSSTGLRAGEEIQGHYLQILNAMKGLDFRGGLDARPPTTVSPATARVATGETVGKSLKAEPLSINPGRYQGRSTSGSLTTLFDSVNEARPYSYVQAHLLNHNLHGPFENWNIVPLPRTDNSWMSGSIEEPIKQKVLSANEVVSYWIEFDFGGHDAENLTRYERSLPTSVRAEAYVMQLQQGVEATEAVAENPDNWVVDSKFVNESRPVQMPSGPVDVIRFDHLALSDIEGAEESAAETTLARIDGIGSDLAGRVVAARPSSEEELAAVAQIGETRANAILEARGLDITISLKGTTIRASGGAG